ncbi:hypothetical protein [Streptomyces sp. BBFR109]
MLFLPPVEVICAVLEGGVQVGESVERGAVARTTWAPCAAAAISSAMP